MNILLMIHVLLAVVTVAASIKVLIDIRGQRQSITQSLYAMWSSFGAVAATGVVLVVVTPQTMVHTCVMMSAYVVLTSGLQIYQKRAAKVYQTL